jgi:hypothetical protein
MSLNFGLTNLFQMKLHEGENEKKVDLFNLDFRTGYNFAADSLKLANLTSSVRANPRRNINVTMGATHSFYDYNKESGRTVDQFLGGKLLRLTRLQLDARWTLSGQKRRDAGQPPDEFSAAALQSPDQLDGYDIPPDQEIRDDLAPETAFSAFDLPWRATFAFSYSINKFNPNNPIRSMYVDVSNVELQLTRKWRIGYRLRYDIEKGEMVDQRFSFYRALHCWEAQLNWSPSGISKGFYFKINIKAPQLNSVKWDYRGGSSSAFSPY